MAILNKFKKQISEFLFQFLLIISSYSSYGKCLPLSGSPAEISPNYNCPFFILKSSKFLLNLSKSKQKSFEIKKKKLTVIGEPVLSTR